MFKFVAPFGLQCGLTTRVQPYIVDYDPYATATRTWRLGVRRSFVECTAWQDVYPPASGLAQYQRYPLGEKGQRGTLGRAGVAGSMVT